MTTVLLKDVRKGDIIEVPVGSDVYELEVESNPITNRDGVSVLLMDDDCRVYGMAGSLELTVEMVKPFKREAEG